MYIYWRIQSDLNELGNFLIFNHPNLQREFEKWVRRNSGGLSIAENLAHATIDLHDLSQN